MSGIFFNMFPGTGLSKNAIVHYLNDHGILSPAAYKRERLGLNIKIPALILLNRLYGVLSP